MRYRIIAAVACTFLVAAGAVAKEKKKIAVTDFRALGEATGEQAMDVADNIRLVFLAADTYDVETYERLSNAVDAAVKAGLDLTAVKDITRLGKALGDGVVVTGTVARGQGLYSVQINFTNVKKGEAETAYEGAGADLRTVTEELIKQISGAEKFGVLFPDAIRPRDPSKEKEVYKIVKAVGSPQEVAIFETVSPRGQSMFLDKFWLRRDPDPATPENEFETQVWDRLAYVQKNFSNPIHEGVETDRGRVYITYGAPDEIEDYSGGLASISGIEESTWSTKPYYAWKYYGGRDAAGKRMIFVFIDDAGDGEFQIFASTEVGYGRRINNFQEFDMNRLVRDAADTGEASDTFWDPGRYSDGGK